MLALNNDELAYLCVASAFLGARNLTRTSKYSLEGPNPDRIKVETHAIQEDLKNIKKAMQAYEDDPGDPDGDPLEYWRSGEAPRNHWLRLCAQHMFCIPGSSSSVERAFSHAGGAITVRRSRLKSKRAAAIMFLHENLLELGLF